MWVELVELETSRTQLFEWVASALAGNERRLPLSNDQGKPDWAPLSFEGLDQWLAIQWKLHSIRPMSLRSHQKALDRLSEFCFEV